MKKRITIIAALLIFLLFFWFFKIAEKQKSCKTLAVMTYNAQCFFDSVYNGCEFAEFGAKSKYWNDARYIGRLENLAAVITRHAADVLFLQEIENSRVIEDLFNFLPVSTPYKFACFAKEENGAFGCAVLSKYPIKSMQTHQFSFSKNGKIDRTSMRPLMQVQIAHPKTELVVFAVHWKSKKGSDAESDFLRYGQESVLASQIEKIMAQYENAPENLPLVLVAGDCNRSIEEFESGTQQNQVVLHGKNRTIEMVSPWLIFNNSSAAPDTAGFANLAAPGSYCYQGQWSKIDNIFMVDSGNTGGNAFFSGFSVIADDGMLDQTGAPKRYFAFKGEGFSDHLPVWAEITF